MSGHNNGFSSPSYGGSNNAAYVPYSSPVGGGSGSASMQSPSLRRRAADPSFDHGYVLSPNNGSGSRSILGDRKQGEHKYSPSPRGVVKKLDFMFPKVDTEYTVKTDSGGVASVVAYCIIAVLIIAEWMAWSGQNSMTTEHISVDTSLGKRMRVNLNITFPGLACEDLHVDVMDVAGDSQLNIEDTMVKTRVSSRGKTFGLAESVESNKHRLTQENRKKIYSENVPEEYCGPCFGAQEKEGDCCNTCEELMKAYEKKRWRTDVIQQTSEQCIREGRDKLQSPKLMKKGEGCNLSGSMTLNRVAGNFHIAMGEGIERDGRHIHSFVPEDSPNFNASHIIHHLSFGAPDESGPVSDDQASLNGVTKIVSKEYGTTGLFQYFIKIVPTTYIKDDPAKKGRVQRMETNRYFFTERFRPLMSHFYDDDDTLDDDAPFLRDAPDGYGKTISDSLDSEDDEDLSALPEEERKVKEAAREQRAEKRRLHELKKQEIKEARKNIKAHEAGAGGGHSNHDHHHVRNAILPGIFFIYEIYPFEVEVSQSSVPLTHLLIRILATVGGVLTIGRWLDSLFYSQVGHQRSNLNLR